MTTRRTFLEAGAVTGATLAAMPATAAPVPPATDVTFDYAAIAARFAVPARHRQVFAVARPTLEALNQMHNGIVAYDTTMGEGPGAMHAVAVFYSTAVVLGFDDAIWQRYRIAETLRRRGAALPQGTGNPFASMLAELVKLGGDFFACNNALEYFAQETASNGLAGDLTVGALCASLRSHLVRGALLVPAGVAALNQAQEARYTYVQASL